MRRIYQVIQGEEVVVLPPRSTVQEAAAAMRDSGQCVVLVMAAERLEGILTEQDVVRRVVAACQDPQRVTVAEAMTPQPDTITPGDLALKGLQMMEDGHYRHLPVMCGGRVVGLISRPDFTGSEKTELETQRHCWEVLG